MTFLWYDLETSGTNPFFDRIIQFAALRTDSDLQPIDDPVILYGKLSPDYLPDPQACLVTGIVPQEANAKGLCEADLLKALNPHFSRPGTCSLGYNTIGFDDEFIRNLYYRNFHDPYRREWAEGNSRWDIINLTRATRDLRPEGIVWPRNDKGRSTIRLEELTRANGLSHEQAHDALSDVHAVIALARLMREHQPRLYEWALAHRTREAARPLIDLDDRTPIVHTASYLQGPRGCTTLAAPLIADPVQRNLIHAFDLRQDPEDLLTLPVDEIRRRVFTRTSELEAEGTSRIALMRIAMNKAPFIAPSKVLSPQSAERLGIDIDRAMHHWQKLREDQNLVARLREVFTKLPSEAVGLTDDRDPDLQIYEHFFPDEDAALFERIRRTAPEELPNLQIKAKDPRVPEMLRRYIGRNWPHVLSDSDRRRWKSFCASRLLFPPIPGASNLSEYRKRLAAWRENDDLAAEKKPIIKALEEYGDYLEKIILKNAPDTDTQKEGAP